MANVKVKTNIPEIMTFKFNTWKRWENEGTNGKYITYSIGVENRGIDAYFSVYEREYNNIFSQLGNLQDRTLTVEKYEDGKYKNWRILENGQDITPQYRNTQNLPPQSTNTSYPTSTTNPSVKLNLGANTGLTEQIKQLNKNQDKLVDKIKDLEQQIQGLYGALINEENEQAYEIHKSIKLKKVEEPQEEVKLNDLQF